MPADKPRLGVVGEFGPLYEAAAGRGISPPVLDEMELWQVGTALGIEQEGADVVPIRATPWNTDESTAAFDALLMG